MAMPTQNDLKTAILHLVQSAGGQIRTRDTYGPLADYFHLSDEDLTRKTSSNANQWRTRVGFARKALVDSGFLDGSTRGLWKLTRQGERELQRLGLYDRRFPCMPSSQKIESDSKNLFEHAKELEDQAWVELVLAEVLPKGLKRFPDDFISKDVVEGPVEVKLPMRGIKFAPFSRATLVGEKEKFRYDARNPSDAWYILYSYVSGYRNVRLPANKRAAFLAVKAYEKYIRGVCQQANDLFKDAVDSQQQIKPMMRSFLAQIGLTSISVCCQ